jgi:hypothetical protein
LVAKYRVLRYSGADLLDPVSLRYLLWDPEVESHSFDIGNVDEMVAFCADAFDLPPEDVRRYMTEARSDPELTTLLRRRTRWAFDLKTQPPLAQRLLWWVLVRGQKPGLIVETGVYEGLGSLVLLVAAERNAREGGPDARVVSIDSDPRSGRLVPKHLEHRWEKVIGDTSDVLEDAIGHRRIGVFIHDTPHTEATQRHEFELALRNRADPLTIVDGGGGQIPTLAELAAQHGVVLHHAVPQPAGHPVRISVDFATFRGPGSRPSS